MNNLGPASSQKYGSRVPAVRIPPDSNGWLRLSPSGETKGAAVTFLDLSGRGGLNADAALLISGRVQFSSQALLPVPADRLHRISPCPRRYCSTPDRPSLFLQVHLPGKKAAPIQSATIQAPGG